MTDIYIYIVIINANIISILLLLASLYAIPRVRETFF